MTDNISASALEAAFPSFDIKGALELMAGHAGLLLKVLQGFYDQYKDTAIPEIKAFLDAEKYQDAARLAHTFKGLAGTIGAVKFKESCLNLETVCKSDNPASGKDEAFLIFSNDMQDTLNVIAAGLKVCAS